MPGVGDACSRGLKDDAFTSCDAVRAADAEDCCDKFRIRKYHNHQPFFNSTAVLAFSSAVYRHQKKIPSKNIERKGFSLIRQRYLVTPLQRLGLLSMPVLLSFGVTAIGCYHRGVAAAIHAYMRLSACPVSFYFCSCSKI